MTQNKQWVNNQTNVTDFIYIDHNESIPWLIDNSMCNPLARKTERFLGLLPKGSSEKGYVSEIALKYVCEASQAIRYSPTPIAMIYNTRSNPITIRVKCVIWNYPHLSFPAWLEPRYSHFRSYFLTWNPLQHFAQGIRSIDPPRIPYWKEIQ